MPHLGLLWFTYKKGLFQQQQMVKENYRLLLLQTHIQINVIK